MRLIISIILICFTASCSKQITTKQPISISYFNIGDTLLPDYYIVDTLIVVDAVNLNKEIALEEQGIKYNTDREISDLFYKYCRIK